MSIGDYLYIDYAQFDITEKTCNYTKSSEMAKNKISYKGERWGDFAVKNRTSKARI